MSGIGLGILRVSEGDWGFLNGLA